MGLSVCPVEVVAAPIELVWSNLVQWDRFCEWAGVQVDGIEPEGLATPDQTIYFRGRGLSRNLRFVFKVEEVDSNRHQLGLDVLFPLGLREKPHISCQAIDATTCRVQYG